MKKKAMFFSLGILALMLSGCAPAARPNTTMPMNNNGSPMMTATPGSMMVENPEAAHMMEPITAPNVQPATETEGGQPLEFREENGVKIFELTTKAVQWNILDGVTVTAYTYNGTVPGPLIHVTEGDQVRIIVKNELPDPTTIHWHGVEVPNSMDGGLALHKIPFNLTKPLLMNSPPSPQARSCITHILKVTCR